MNSYENPYVWTKVATEMCENLYVETKIATELHENLYTDVVRAAGSSL